MTVASDEEVYIFLEHHGVKGQKWGVRTAKTIGRGAAATGRGLVRGAKFANRHRKATAVVSGAVVVAAGAFFVNRGLKNWGSRTMNDIPSFNAARPPKWNFRAKGPGFETVANDGRTFDTLIKNLKPSSKLPYKGLTDAQRREWNHNILKRNKSN